MGASMYRLEVNGRRHEVRAEPNTPLLLVLRNALGLTGAKFGCGQGLCGSCTVWIDGHPTPSCDQPVEYVGERPVRTIEDLSDAGEPGALQSAFLTEQAAQCGYCIPGILMSAAALLRDNPAPTRDDVVAALDRHLCRCGSHERIVRAVLSMAAS
ncbi:MAG: (2Fe-2S)-binding protein [Nocardioidaceae bacterium]